MCGEKTVQYGRVLFLGGQAKKQLTQDTGLMSLGGETKTDAGGGRLYD